MIHSVSLQPSYPKAISPKGAGVPVVQSRVPVFFGENKPAAPPSRPFALTRMIKDLGQRVTKAFTSPFNEVLTERVKKKLAKALYRDLKQQAATNQIGWKAESYQARDMKAPYLTQLRMADLDVSRLKVKGIHRLGLKASDSDGKPANTKVTASISRHNNGELVLEVHNKSILFAPPQYLLKPRMPVGAVRALRSLYKQLSQLDKAGKLEKTKQGQASWESNQRRNQYLESRFALLKAMSAGRIEKVEKTSNGFQNGAKTYHFSPVQLPPEHAAHLGLPENTPISARLVSTHQHDWRLLADNRDLQSVFPISRGISGVIHRFTAPKIHEGQTALKQVLAMVRRIPENSIQAVTTPSSEEKKP